MKIAVLCGGISMERDVSLTTGAMVAKALWELGHQAAVVDLYLGVEEPIHDMAAFFAAGGSVTAAAGVQTSQPDLQAVRALRKGSDKSRIGPQVIAVCDYADIVFLGLHGADGEDGKIQALFDLLGIKYTGSGSLGSAMAMDKDITKTICRAAGLQVPGGFKLAAGEAIPQDQLQFPCFVKPCCGGSSVATTMVEQEADLQAALDAVFDCGDIALVEPQIKGREIQVGILGDIALPPIELQYESKFFDYVMKYQSGACREICPAPVDDETCRKLQQAALTAFRSLHLAVYSRADFILREDGEIFLLEINTLPGMTATSLVPQEAAELGISYHQLCEKIIQLSFDRYKQ